MVVFTMVITIVSEIISKLYNITMVIYCIYNTINGINGYVNGNITNIWYL